MKKIFFLLAVAAIASAASCNDESKSKNGVKRNETWWKANERNETSALKWIYEKKIGTAPKTVKPIIW